LTLFRPATGELRAQPVLQAPNAVLHPWLQAELMAILAALPPVLDPQAPGRLWQDWGWGEAEVAAWEGSGPLPPVRMILVWDNLRGHKTPELVDWCVHQGILPLYTPLGGSWLNMAESVQRIVVRRALAGQHPESAATVMEWLGAAVAGWNRAPTPFAWGGKRAARRQRARERRHRLGGSGAYTWRRLPRRTKLETWLVNINSHDK
jgi:DDE superfamily endonuclease